MEVHLFHNVALFWVMVLYVHTKYFSSLSNIQTFPHIITETTDWSTTVSRSIFLQRVCTMDFSPTPQNTVTCFGIIKRAVEVQYISEWPARQVMVPALRRQLR